LNRSEPYNNTRITYKHWAIVDLVGKGGHVRTVPVPDWVRGELDDWLAAAVIDRSRKALLRVNKIGKVWGEGMTEKAVWHIVKESARAVGIAKLAPHSASDPRSALPRFRR
jgi:site-specific recombinase XerD